MLEDVAVVAFDHCFAFTVFPRKHNLPSQPGMHVDRRSAGNVKVAHPQDQRDVDDGAIVDGKL